MGQGRATCGAARASRSRDRRRDTVHAHVRARAGRHFAPSRVRGRPAPHAARRDRWRHAPSLLFVLVFAGLRTPASDYRQAHARGTGLPAPARAHARRRHARRDRPVGPVHACDETDTRAHDCIRRGRRRASRRSSASPRHCCAKSRASRAILLCGNRCEDEIIFRERIDALEVGVRAAPRRRHALDAAARRTGAAIAGALDGAATLRGCSATTDADAFYVCGPEAMMARRMRRTRRRRRRGRSRPHRAVRLRDRSRRPASPRTPPR